MARGRGRPRSRAHSPTPGGAKLRQLRLQAGLPILEVAECAMIDPSHLQRIEVGDIIRPDYETLVALLVKGLPATFPERRMVLKAFDYHIDTPLPDTTEIAAAIA